MQYYMHVNGVQLGPLDESELMLNGLTPSTPVWTDGMMDWQPANQLPALAYLFAGQTPPPPPYMGGQPPYGSAYSQPQYAAPQPSQPMPPTNLVWAILATLFCFWPLGIVSIVKASQVSTLYNRGDYQGSLEASRDAAKWAKWSAIVAVIVTAVIIGFYLLVGLSVFAFAGF